MIARIAGTLTEVSDDGILVQVQDVCYETLVPACDSATHQGRIGQQVTLHTLDYLEGSVGHGNLIPRLIGFLRRADKAFFELFTGVKGIGMRKALRALAIPPARIAAAIENKDPKQLAELPEIGKRTAEQIVAQLNGKLDAFVQASDGSAGGAEPLPQFATAALEIMLQLGERRIDADSMIRQVLTATPAIDQTNALVQQVYRLKLQGSPA